MGKNKIIVALDVATSDEARRVVDELAGVAVHFKIGLQLFLAAGKSFVEELVAKDLKIFLDLKFHDIPTTVANASVEAAKMGVWMLNVHALGGAEMIRRSVESVGQFCETENSPRPLMIGVTILTSADQASLKASGIDHDIPVSVERLAKLSYDNGLDGVVASPLEIELIRSKMTADRFLIVTPGIRPENATNDDQKRVMTPSAAITLGADHLVIGRPITQSADPRAAFVRISKELEGSLDISARRRT